jgi:flagellar hook-associated protein 3 FlgL
MISLSTSAFYERATRQVGSLRAQAEELQQQIGTGERLSRSSDDPVAAARLRTLERGERLAEIDQRNSDVASNDLAMTDDALGSIANVIIRAQELATHAANGVLSPEQRASIGTEITNLQQSLLLVANGRDSAGHALFGGQAAGAAYELVGGVYTYVGTATKDGVDLGEGQSVIPALTGPEVLQFDVDGVQTDLFAVLGNLAAALQGGVDQTGASRDALDGLAAGLDKVTTGQTVIGARMGWVELMNDRRIANSELVADEQETIGGADLAETMTRLQEVTTVLEASQASFVRLANLTLFDMLR